MPHEETGRPPCQSERDGEDKNFASSLESSPSRPVHSIQPFQLLIRRKSEALYIRGHTGYSYFLLASNEDQKCKTVPQTAVDTTLE
jgi:hypothetical protein